MIDRKFLAVVFILLMAVAVFQAQSQQQNPAAGAKAKGGKTTMDKEPPLDETMNWIVNSLSVTTYAGYKSALTKSGTCSLRIVFPVNAVPHRDDNINLAELDPTSAKVKQAVNLMQALPPTSPTIFELSASTTNTSTATFDLFLLDESLANRGKTALVHAIELCGGKKSTF
jgi:hypothetical protein